MDTDPASLRRLEITALVLRRLLDGPAAPELLDVREPYERAQSYLAGSRHIPVDEVDQRAPAELPDRERPIVAYCAAGIRSLSAARRLLKLGYRNVLSLAGGIVEKIGTALDIDLKSLGKALPPVK